MLERIFGILRQETEATLTEEHRGMSGKICGMIRRIISYGPICRRISIAIFGKTPDGLRLGFLEEML